MVYSSSIRRGFFVLSCVSVASMMCSNEQMFISVSVCAFCTMILVSVAVELHARTREDAAAANNQIVQRTCRSPLATNPFLLVAMLVFAGVYILWSPFATQFLPDELALRAYSNSL